jgi:hypothetical protein
MAKMHKKDVLKSQDLTSRRPCSTLSSYFDVWLAQLLSLVTLLRVHRLETAAAQHQLEMSENDANRSDNAEALWELPRKIDKACLCGPKLRSKLTKIFKPSGGPAKLRYTNTAVKSIRGLPPEPRPEFEKDSQPSATFATSDSSSIMQASAREPHSKLGPKLGGESQAPDACTKSKASSSADVTGSGPLLRLFSNAQKHRSNVVRPLRSPPKPPTFRSRTDAGPSSLADHCKVSTVHLVPPTSLNILSKYWFFRDNFDRLVRRSYLQADEIQCLLGCIKSAPSSIGMMHGNLVSVHRALHDDLGRLHRCIKEEADLDEDMAQTVLEEVKTFMERFEALTTQFQLACQNLQDIFEKAIAFGGSLDGRMTDPREVFSEQSELRLTGMCWNLRRAIQPLIEAISSERRRGRDLMPEVIVAKPVQEQGRGKDMRSPWHVKFEPCFQGLEPDSGGAENQP